MGCWLIRESFPVSAIFSFGKRRRVRKVETSTATPPYIKHSSTEQPQQPRAATPRDRTRAFCVLATAIALSPEESNAESELTWEAHTQRFAASLTADLTLDTSSRCPTVEFIELSDAASFYGRQLIDGLYRTS